MTEQPDRDRARRRWWAVLVPLWILALAYVGSTLRYGWIPHDEGTLAQAADRVLAGEIPHRDFDEVYTGGLSWWNALAFRAFGTSLWSMRLALFAVFALWVPAVYWIATRFAGPWTSAAFTALAVVWSVPIYTAPMPSWYLLFLATFGTAALLKHLDDGRRRWLVAAGLCAGVATLAKVTGLHFAAAALLFFAWREPALTAGPVTPRRRPDRSYPLAITLLLAAFVAALVKQVWSVGTRTESLDGEIEYFVLPGAVVAFLVARRAWSGSQAPTPARLRALFGLAVPFLLGLLAPIALFVARYAAAGALDALVQGTLVLPGRRMALPTASTPAPSLATLLYLAPIAAIAAIPPAAGRRWPGIALIVSGVALFAALGVGVLPTEWKVPLGRHAYGSKEIFWIVHATHAHVMPWVALVLLWKLRKASFGPGAALPDGAVLLVTVSALVSLVQFPFTVPIYFFYFAPLLVLAVLGLLQMEGGARSRPGVLMLLGFWIIFMLAVPMRGGEKGGWTSGVRLQTPRSGLEMWRGDVGEYDPVLAAVRERARGGYVWAGPDAPEVPFLAGMKNPTRTIFDCFDADYASDPRVRIDRLMRELDEHGVTAVVLNRKPSFSDGISPELKQALEKKFPHGSTFWKFVVAWRE